MPHFTSDSIPDFPSDVPIAELDTISLQTLLESDPAESLKLYEACRASGFFLLNLQGSEEGSELLDGISSLFGLGEKLYDMPLDEKMQYALRPGTAFGYKGIGVSKVDSKGTPDRCEFWGVSKDEILSQAANPCPMPPIFTENLTFLQHLTRKAHSLCLQLLFYIEPHLDLPAGTLASKHRIEAASADQFRILKMGAQGAGDKNLSLLPHTDYGTLTLLWNILGGLQILPPDAGQTDPDGLSPKWQYVKPQTGCVVVNVGDALVSLTGGVMRSNLHRVVAPPGEQANFERYSLAYFSRPEDDVLMQPLNLGWNGTVESKGDVEKVYTAKEWVGLKSDRARRSPEEMKSSGGKV